MTKRNITAHKGGRTAIAPGARIRPQTLQRIHEAMRKRKASFADLLETEYGDDTMNYTIEVSEFVASNVIAGETVRGAKKAAKTAREYAKKYPKPKYQVFVSWHRSSDGQTGYLNPDGNHAITGKAW